MHATSHLPYSRPQLLDGYPLIRSRSATEARDLVGRVLSPHHLQVRTHARAFEARHNQIRLQQSAINVLSYGAEVEIDPGERGDYYLLQLPLQGRARVRCNDQEAWVHPEVMSVLQPHARTRMVWSSDCAMIMLQVPSQTVRTAWQADDGPLPALRLTRSRQDPAVSAWWQAVGDMTRNLHHHGAQWLRHPAAFAAMEGFLISGLDLLRPGGPEDAAPAMLADSPRLQRAVDYIQAHAHEGLTLAAIAAAACMSPRALEAAFRRRYDNTPLAYARGVRLQRVHDALVRAARAGDAAASVTDIALQHGFIHMGRFAAYYRQRFGCSPSVSLRRH
jgi:AraC-like DNA-binding protein